ncbi:MAG: hypothetical protein ABI855_02260 [Bacteroidota bacterium]
MTDDEKKKLEEKMAADIGQVDYTKMITIYNWRRYCVEIGDYSPGFGGYVDANDHIAKELRLRIERGKDFESLKKEMMEFLIDREVFVKFANCNLP